MSSFEVQCADHAYLCARNAQQAINKALSHPLVKLDVSCATPPAGERAQALRKFLLSSPFQTDGSIHIPNPAVELHKYKANDPILAGGESLADAVNSVREVYDWIGRLNDAVGRLIDVDVTVHAAVKSVGSKPTIGLSISKRFKEPLDEAREQVAWDTMSTSIWEMRRSNHKSLEHEEASFYGRFGKPCPPEPTAHDTPRL